MKNLTKIISLMLFLIMLAGAFTSCGDTESTPPPAPPTNEERLRTALEAMENVAKAEISADLDITVTLVYGSQRQVTSYDMDMEMQLDKTNPDDEITHTVSYLTATSSGGSATIKSEMFSKDGYMYTDMAGQKTKQYLPKDDEDEENPVSLALKYLSTAVYTENADGSLTVSVTVEASKNEEAKKAFISLFDMGMTEKEIRLCTTTDAIIEFVIDKDNNLKSFSFPIEYSLVQTISGSSSLYSTVVKYTMSMTVDSIGGSFVITLPSDLDSYK